VWTWWVDICGGRFRAFSHVWWPSWTSYLTDVLFTARLDRIHGGVGISRRGFCVCGLDYVYLARTQVFRFQTGNSVPTRRCGSIPAVRRLRETDMDAAISLGIMSMVWEVVKKKKDEVPFSRWVVFLLSCLRACVRCYFACYASCLLQVYLLPRHSPSSFPLPSLLHPPDDGCVFFHQLFVCARPAVGGISVQCGLMLRESVCVRCFSGCSERKGEGKGREGKGRGCQFLQREWGPSS